MSNLGLERFLAGQGLAMHRTQVGDRYVAERMREVGMNLGGEQSGHVILSDFATTGDGLLAALQVLAVIVEQGRSAREVCRVFTPLPQLLKNVRFAGASPLRGERIQHAIAAAEAALNGSGRLLIRESGTEPLIRVMAEGEDEALIGRMVDELCETIAAATRVSEVMPTDALGARSFSRSRSTTRSRWRSVLHTVDHVAIGRDSGTCRNRRCPRRSGIPGSAR